MLRSDHWTFVRSLRRLMLLFPWMVISSVCVSADTLEPMTEDTGEVAATSWGDSDELSYDEYSCDGFACAEAEPFADKFGGDWWGWRTHLAEKGITYNNDHVGIVYGVANGGAERDARLGGHSDAVMNVDFGKLGVQEGLFLKVRAEYRYGESLAGATGAILPSYVITDLPVRDSRDLYITNVLFTQMLSSRFGVFAGKLDTLDGDANDFAHDRGKDQFSNIAFVSAPIALSTVPYSTLGTGFFYLGEDGTPLFSFNLLNSTDTTRTTGFSELFANGATLTSELRLPTRFGGKLGHQLVGGTYSTRDDVSLDQDPRIILPQVPIRRQSDSWSLYYNFDQYLFTQPGSTSKGWGTFGRAGIADRESNPIEWFLSYGVGGFSPLADRDNDRFGAGWFIAGTSTAIDPVLANAIGPLQNGQGVETFYNYQVRPWMHVTTDMQYIVPSRSQFNDALVLGLRTRIDF